MQRQGTERTSRPPVRVLVCHSNSLVRIGLRTVLRGHPEFQVVGTVSDVEDVVRQVRDGRADAVVASAATLPDSDSLAALPVPVVALVADTEQAAHWMRFGPADGCVVVHEDADAAELPAAVEAAVSGAGHVSSALSAVVLELAHSWLSVAGGPVPTHTPLTPRESEVLSMLLQGLTNREIGSSLGVGEKTIKFHVSNILTKARLRSRAQIIARSRREPRHPEHPGPPRLSHRQRRPMGEAS